MSAARLVYPDSATLYPISVADLVLPLGEVEISSAARAHVLLSADRCGYPERDTSPARRRHPDNYLTQILADFADQVTAILHAMVASRARADQRRRHDRRLATSGPGKVQRSGAKTHRPLRLSVCAHESSDMRRARPA